MVYKNPFKNSVKQRKKIIIEQTAQIKSIYRQAYENIYDMSNQLYRTTSDNLKQLYLNNLKKELINNMENVDKQTERIINNNMDKMVSAVLNDNVVYLKSFNYNNFINNSDIRNKVVESILSGKVYENSWSLSSAIWGNNKQRIKEIEKLIARGVMEGKTTDQIAKSLTQYINPRIRSGTPIDWRAQDWQGQLSNMHTNKPLLNLPV